MGDTSAAAQVPPDEAAQALAQITSSRKLFLSGHVEGRQVCYQSSGQVLLTGTVRGGGIACDCQQCNGQQIVSTTVFEQHAGSTAHRPGEFIKLDDQEGGWISLQNQIRSLQEHHTEQQPPEKKIKMPAKQSLSPPESRRDTFLRQLSSALSLSTAEHSFKQKLMEDAAELTAASMSGLVYQHEPFPRYQVNGHVLSMGMPHTAGVQARLPPPVGYTGLPALPLPPPGPLALPPASLIDPSSIPPAPIPTSHTSAAAATSSVPPAPVLLSDPVPLPVQLSVRSLLRSGELEGRQVTYASGGVATLTGVIRGDGIQCNCSQCQGKQVVKISVFEVHAGSTARHPADNIVLDDGRSLRTVLLGDDGSRKRRKLHMPAVPPPPVASVTPGASELAAQSPQASVAPPQEVGDAPGQAPDAAAEQMLPQVIHTQQPAPKTAAKRKVTRDSAAMCLESLPEGEELAYTKRGQAILRGRKDGAGIRCSHCNAVVTPSKFERHSGNGSCHKPYEAIVVVSTGETLKSLLERAKMQMGYVNGNPGSRGAAAEGVPQPSQAPPMMKQELQDQPSHTAQQGQLPHGGQPGQAPHMVQQGEAVYMGQQGQPPRMEQQVQMGQQGAIVHGSPGRQHQVMPHRGEEQLALTLGYEAHFSAMQQEAEGAHLQQRFTAGTVSPQRHTLHSTGQPLHHPGGGMTSQGLASDAMGLHVGSVAPHPAGAVEPHHSSAIAAHLMRGSLVAQLGREAEEEGGAGGSVKEEEEQQQPAVCFKCGNPGPLLPCKNEGCPNGAHAECLRVASRDAVVCPDCEPNGSLDMAGM